MAKFGTHAAFGNGFTRIVSENSKTLPNKGIREVGGNKGGVTSGGNAAKGPAKIESPKGNGLQAKGVGSGDGAKSTGGAAKGPAKMESPKGKGLASGGKGPQVSMPSATTQTKKMGGNSLKSAGVRQQP